MDQNIVQSQNNKYVIELQHLLGQGAFGKVFRAYDLNQQYAIKVINKKELLAQANFRIAQQRLEQEVITWKKCDHPNIVKLLDYANDQENIYFISELCNGQTLQQVIENGKTPYNQALPWIKELCQALDYIHRLEVIHRDIKPTNIMFHNGRIKILDFGLAREGQDDQMTQLIGTRKYMAPEVLLASDEYKQNVDVWGLGWTFYQLLFNQDPWNIQMALNETEMANIIYDSPLSFPMGNDIPEAFIKILTGMLNIDLEERLNHDTLLELVLEL
ncbi:hypothetical protein pb186bvf_015745 [Paramecium bursaria]